MRNKFSKSVLAAGFGLAMIFTFSCASGSDDGSPSSGGGTSSSSGGGTSSPSGGNFEYGSMKDNNGKTYKTIEIGGQIWMAENLDYNVSGSECYGKDLAKCAIYGRLYDWKTAMKLPECNSDSCSSQINANHQGICPDDWHIPSNEDWNKLLRYVDDDNDGIGSEFSGRYFSFTAGRYLKAAGWDSYDGKSDNSEDKYGFSALPGGIANDYSGDFESIGVLGTWWSAHGSSGMFFAWDMISGEDFVLSGLNREAGMSSVRCLKNEP